MMSEFVTVYPPPPPTWNHLNSAQRSSLRRSTRKVAKVLGTGMSTNVGGDSAPLPITKPAKRKVFLLRLFSPTSTSPTPPSCEPPVLRFSNRPGPIISTPLQSSTATTGSDESANKRAKLARIQRLLGDEVPVEVLFPSASMPSCPNTPTSTIRDPPSTRRPHTPLPLPQHVGKSHDTRNTVIRVPIPTLTEEEKRLLGLDNQGLQSVHEEEEPASSATSQISDEERTLPGNGKLGLSDIAEMQEPSMAVHSFLDSEEDLDDAQWTTGSYPPSSTPSPISIPFCASPLGSSFISVNEEDVDVFETPVSTWFDGDGQSPTLSRSSSFVSSHYSFHADRTSSDSGRTIESERPLLTPPPLHTLPSSLVGACHNDSIEPISELTDALFASPIQSCWKLASPTVVF